MARGGRALAGLHGDLQELRVRELGEARRQAHETGGNVGVGRTRSLAVRGELNSPARLGQSQPIIRSIPRELL